MAKHDMKLRLSVLSGEAETVLFRYWFSREEGKKSSFIIDFKDMKEESQTRENRNGNDDSDSNVKCNGGYICAEKPVCLVVDCCLNGGNDEMLQSPTTTTVPFLFGGIEIESTSRTVESYITDRNKKEEYLSTSRGIRCDTDDTRKVGEKEEEWHGAVLICPGGPRVVSSLRFKLLSIRPAGNTLASIRLLKFKGRLSPDNEEAAASSRVAKNAGNAQAANQETIDSLRSSTGLYSSPIRGPHTMGVGQDDIQAAMMSITLLSRQMEHGIAKSIENHCNKLQKCFTDRIISLEKSLQMTNMVLNSQRMTIAEQNMIIKRQTERMEDHHNVINGLLERVEKMLKDRNTVEDCDFTDSTETMPIPSPEDVEKERKENPAIMSKEDGKNGEAASNKAEIVANGQDPETLTNDTTQHKNSRSDVDTPTFSHETMSPNYVQKDTALSPGRAKAIATEEIEGLQTSEENDDGCSPAESKLGHIKRTNNVT